VSRSGRCAVDGMLLLNKPAGLTSNRALQQVKRLLQAEKAGHTGSLDPAATGMLPLCFGEATKVCAYLLDADKTYRVTARLGTATDTGDADGKQIAEAPVPNLDQNAWQRLANGFKGETRQIPPMYSALKHGGKRLYELARKGETVDRPARPIVIHDFDVLEVAGSRLVARIHCSKGTYIRTVVEDLAKAANTLAHAERLHRETVADFNESDMLDLSSIEEAVVGGPEALWERLLPADRALSALPAVTVSAADEPKFSGGQAVVCSKEEGQVPGLSRVYGAAGRFLGVGEANASGQVLPKRIFLQREPEDAVTAP